MANKLYTSRTALTGGAANALDYLDGNVLSDGDIALVSVAGVAYTYRLNASSSDSEAVPYIIAPDANPGTKRWELQLGATPLEAKTDNYTVALRDFRSLIVMNCATAKTLTFPAASGFPSGFSIDVVSMGAGAITLAITGGGNWWNTSIAGASVVMGPRCTAWTDGAYWYVSPLNVNIDAIRVLNAGDQTSWTAIDLSASPLLLPTSVKRIGGYFLGQTAVGSSGVAPTSNGYGQVAHPGTGELYVNYAFDLQTPQSMWYRATAGGGTVSVWVGSVGF
jgi:hypothetical protein